MKHLKTVVLLMFLVLAACSEKLDFKQAEDFKHQPSRKNVTGLLYLIFRMILWTQ